MDEFVKALFNVETYKGAKVMRPDLNTYIITKVQGQPLKIVMARKNKDWGVTINVTAFRTDEPDADGALLYLTSEPANDYMKTFWNEMNDLAFNSRDVCNDEMRQWAINVLTKKVVKPKAPNPKPMSKN